MNKFTIPAVIVATGMGVAWSQAPQQGGPFQATRYFETPLEKDPTRVVRLQSEFMPPGSGNEFHVHPGDQWSAVQEGEVTFTLKGQPPRVLKAGDSIYVPRGTVHRNQNLTDKPARANRTRLAGQGESARLLLDDPPQHQLHAVARVDEPLCTGSTVTRAPLPYTR